MPRTLRSRCDQLCLIPTAGQGLTFKSTDWLATVWWKSIHRRPNKVWWPWIWACDWSKWIRWLHLRVKPYKLALCLKTWCQVLRVDGCSVWESWAAWAGQRLLQAEGTKEWQDYRVLVRWDWGNQGGVLDTRVRHKPDVSWVDLPDICKSGSW